MLRVHTRQIEHGRHDRVVGARAALGGESHRASVVRRDSQLRADTAGRLVQNRGGAVGLRPEELRRAGPSTDSGRGGPDDLLRVVAGIGNRHVVVGVLDDTHRGRCRESDTNRLDGHRQRCRRKRRMSLDAVKLPLARVVLHVDVTTRKLIDSQGRRTAEGEVERCRPPPPC